MTGIDPQRVPATTARDYAQLERATTRAQYTAIATRRHKRRTALTTAILVAIMALGALGLALTTMIPGLG